MLKFLKIFFVISCLFIFNCGTGKQTLKNSNPVVTIMTELGNMDVELYSSRAPLTVSNFLKYVDMEMYKNSTFFRTVTNKNQPDNKIKINVIQAGRNNEGEQNFPPINIETTDKTGILHKDGVISMARTEPNTATSYFFICVGDQPELNYGGKRNPDGYGFAAFGKVINGMKVVRKIHRQPCSGQMLNPPVKITNITRKTN